MAGRETKSFEDPFEYLIDASRAGRMIVPFLGAGISAEVGFPPLSLLTEYLAKVQGFLHRGLFRLADWDRLAHFGLPFETGKGLVQEDSLLRQGPLRDYLYRVGWPDPNQLHADLWHYLSYAPEAEGKPFSRRLEWLVARELLRGIWSRDEELAELVWRQLSGGFESTGGGSRGTQPKPWRPSGVYWRELLETLTRSDQDLVDSLFQVLTTRRKPGLAHHYLALLVPVLRLRLFFTINFDPFLEQALHGAGLAPEEFRVSELEPLPHPSLVRDTLAVLKLHGSGHGLRVGESLNAPVDRETKSRFREYLSEDPILLVMGIGGWDERILDLMEVVFRGQAKAGAAGEVVWLHFEPERPPPPVLARFREDGDRLRHYRVRHPGAFLEELYIRANGGHPPTRTGYRPYPPRPIPVSHRTRAERNLWPGGGSIAGTASPKRHRWPPPIQVFRGKADDLGFGASLQLADFVAELSATHQPIWIDLDTLSDVPDLINELVTQLRMYDPTLPPEILSYDVTLENSEKAIRRIVACLGRGRYVVAFSGLEAFGRVPFDHHCALRGLSNRDGFLRNLVLRSFNDDLLSSGERGAHGSAFRLRDSILAFSVQEAPEEGNKQMPARRSSIDWLELIKRIGGTTGTDPVALRPSVRRQIPGKWVRDPSPWLVSDRGSWETLASLCAFRRWRSLVFLPMLDRSNSSAATSSDEPIHRRIRRSEEEVLKVFQRTLIGSSETSVRRVLLNLEGGYLWISRPFRNRLFACFEKEWNGTACDRYGLEALRLATLAKLQRQVARHYFRDLYQTSRDVGALREHLYHRVETVRKLRDLFIHLGETDSVLDEAREEEVRSQLGLREARYRREEERSDLAEGVGELWLEELRALVGVIVQEREELLVRTSGSGLQTWTRALVEQLDTLGPFGDGASTLRARLAGKHSEFDRWRGKLLDEVVEILLDVYRTALETPMLLAQLHEQVERLLASDGRAPRIVREPPLRPRPPADWVDPQVFASLAGSGDPAERDRAPRIVDALLNAADALRRIGRGNETGAVSEAIARLFEAWPEPPSGLMAERDARRHAIVRWHRLEADRVLTTVDSWDVKVTGQRPSATRRRDSPAMGHVTEALELLDYLPEEDYAVRAYLRSLLGRAHTLRREYADAYRQFDLARAGLSRRRASLAPPEALVATYLRNAEALILEAGGKCVRVQSGDRENAIAAVAARLAQAVDLLDHAEVLLESGRRTPEWWACLFQLRAQLHIQRILTMMLEAWSVGEPDNGAQGPGGAEVRAVHSSRIGNATKAVRSGLEAVRRGLDVAPPADDRRRRRFVRLWIELLVVAIYVRARLWQEARQLGEERDETPPRFLDRTWQLWEQVNHQAGLERLPSVSASRSWVRSLEGDNDFMPPRTPYRSARRRIREALETDLEDVLLQAISVSSS